MSQGQTRVSEMVQSIANLLGPLPANAYVKILPISDNSFRDANRHVYGEVLRRKILECGTRSSLLLARR